MMRIPIDRINWAGGNRVFVNLVLIRSPIRLPISAMIDTGSPYTIITEIELKRTRIPYTSLDFKETVKFGDVQLNLYKLGKAILIFKDEDDHPQQFEHEVFAGVFARRNFQLVGNFPSLIGQEFLDKHELSVIRQNGKNYLAKL